MKLIDNFKSLPSGKKAVLCCAAAAVIVAVIVVIFFLRQGYYATTMRLLKIEGTVNIEDAEGNSKPVIDNIRFSSGEALSTGSDGLASVGLDDTKIVTLENDSRVEFTKSRNMLELNLTQGGLYFEVIEHLSPDETFDIRTATMTVGIRGTSGYVFYDDSGRESLVITDGVVHVVATNPDTHEVIETDVSGGHSVKVYIYDETREEGSIEFFLEELAEDEIPAFPLRMLAENPELLERVCDYTGWSSDAILSLVDSIESGDYETEETEETSETEPTDAPDPEDDLTPTPSDTPTPTDTPTDTPTARPTATVTPEVTDAPAVTNTLTPAPSGSPTPTDTPTAIPTDSPANKPATDPTVTPTAIPTSTAAPTVMITDTPTAAPTETPVATPTDTPVPTDTPTPTDTPIPTDTPTATPLDTPTPTDTPTATPLDTPTPTDTPPNEVEPTIPGDYSGYTKTNWGSVDDYGNTAYLLRAPGRSDNQYEAYVGDGEWITVYYGNYFLEDGQMITAYFYEDYYDTATIEDAYFIIDIDYL